MRGAAYWERGLAVVVLPSFDLDGNGSLSLMEFRACPHANPLASWHELKTDADNDGFLSLAEFRWQDGLALSAITAEFFQRFDRNRDGKLDVEEFRFLTPNRSMRLTIFSRGKS